MLLPRIKLRSQHLRPVILTCFFVSGACGLIYQVAWLRVMGLIFGNTTFAACTVLAGYMAGLGLGALYFGRRIDAGGNPVLFYGRLELGVAFYAFLTPVLWKLMEWGCIIFYRYFQPDFLTLSLFRFAIAFAALFIPTFLMGGTLPVMVKYFVERKEHTAREVGRLYALNTAGAVLGVYLSGFYMLYTVGVYQSALLTGVLNAVIYYFAASLAPLIQRRSLPEASRQGEEGRAAGSSGPAVLSRFLPPVLLVLFALSGGVSMVYEIGWTRVLAIALGSSVYAFSIMLATFLLGIAVGSWLFSVYSKKFSVGLFSFAVLEILTALFVLIGLNQFDDLSYRFVEVFNAARGQTALLDLGRFILCASVMLPPTLCIGALFACFIHVYQSSGQLGLEVGKAYFANTLGTIAGSVLTGFALIPLFGIQQTLVGGAWLNAAIGAAACLLAWKTLSLRKAILTLGLLLAVTASSCGVEPWNKTVLSSDTAVNPSRVKGLNREQFLRSMRERETIFYKEGTSATVSVTRLRDDLSLAVNGKTDASTNDAFTQFLLGHLPFFARPEAESVLVIGLGSGSTLAAAASHPVKKLDAVELESAVVDAAHFFKDLNRNVLEDPRLRLFHNDGRNFLLLRPDTYDVIISEPSNPWMAGVANLFSLEHYQTLRTRLNPDGVVCQWLHAYSMSTRDLQMIIKTFASVFPNASLWTSYYPDLMLLGSEKPIAFDKKQMRKVYERPFVAEDLREHGLETPESILANYWLGPQEIAKLIRGGKVNTDNFPILEFSAPRYLYAQTLAVNFKFLSAYRSENLPVNGLEAPPQKNGLLYLRLVRAYIAKRFMKEAQWALEQASATESGTAEFALIAAELYFANKKFPEARVLFETLAAGKPESARAQYFLGRIAKEQNDLDRAYLHSHKAVLLSAEEPLYAREYFSVLCARGDLPEAGRAFEKLKALGQDDFEMMALFFKLLTEKGSQAAQAAMASILLERYPRFETPYFILGGFYESTGRPWEALKVYQRMTAELPQEKQAHLRLAMIYKVLKKEKESKSSLNKALQLDPLLKKNKALLRAFND